MPQQRVGGFCSASPNYSCYKNGWPSCCAKGNCPNFPTMCDNTGTGGNYCSSWSPDYSCWPSSNGRPPCCTASGGPYANCPLTSDVDKYQPCESPVNRNECSSNSNCRSNEYCDFPEGDCGDSSRGQCKPIPSGQDCNGVTNNAVCGCDNVKYKNWCKANQQGRTSIQNQGSCSNEMIAFE